MGRLNRLWTKFSQTDALEHLSGPLERRFFEPLYRVTYITGLSTAEKTNAYVLYRCAVQALSVWLMCGEVWFIFADGSPIVDITKSLNVLIITLITQCRYINMVINKSLYHTLAQSMASPNFDTSTNDRQMLVNAWVRKNKTYLKLLLVLGNVSILFWLVEPLVDNLKYNLIIEIRLPFNHKTPELYPVLYMVEVLAVCYAGYMIMVTALTTQTHLVHILCQFAVLADCFEHVLNDCMVGFEDINKADLVYNEEFVVKYKKRLANLVQQHEFILRNAKNLETALSTPMLVQLAASGSAICFLTYQAATTISQGLNKSFINIIFLLYNLFELYIICSWCEEITSWSYKIGEAIYRSGWECGVSKIRGVRSIIVMVIGRANKPFYFRAGGLYNLSNDYFATLLKGCYSVVTVMLRFRPE